MSTDDSDLEDLISNKKAEKSLETAPLNLDHLTKGQLDVSPRTVHSPGFCSLVSAHCSYLCYMYPRTCGLLTFMIIGFIMFFVIGAILNPTEYFGIIDPDHIPDTGSELTIGQIGHWCLKGDNDSCRCDDPLEGISRGEFSTWTRAHEANKEMIQQYKGSDYLDVAFLGESLVEEMDGRWMGRVQKGVLHDVHETFERNFGENGSGIKGIALGVAGDTSPNVLWRLMHGEMPRDFNPRVWWIVLGMNDIGRMQCSEEVVVLGILRVVEEIHKNKPDAKIVINSMLPMADLRGGLYPLMRDYEDAFKGKTRPIRTTNFARSPEEMANLPNPTKIRYQRPQTTTTVLRKHHGIGAIKNIDYKKLAEAKVKERLRSQNAVGSVLNKDEETKKEEEPEIDRGDDEHMGDDGDDEGEDGGDDGEEDGDDAEEDGKEKDDKKVEGEGEKKQETKGEKKQETKGEKKQETKGEKKQETKGEKKQETKGEKTQETKNGEKRRTLRVSADEEDRTGAASDKPSKKEELAMRKYAKRYKRDPINPKLVEGKTHIKARDPKKLFLQKNRLPLWTSISAINKELEKFARKHDYIEFFDATRIFTEYDGAKRVLRSDRISIRGHPNNEGFKAWEDKMLEKLQKMLQAQDKELEAEAEDEAGQDTETDDEGDD